MKTYSKKGKALLLIPVIVVFLSILAILLPKKEIVDQILSALTVASSLASIIAIFFALDVYRKLTIDSHIIDKRVEVVLKLLETIRSIDIFIYSPKVVDNSGAYFRLSYDNLLPKADDLAKLNEFKNYRLVFNIRYMQFMFKFSDFARNVFIPGQIATLVRPMEVNLLNFPNGSADNYAKVVVDEGQIPEEFKLPGDKRDEEIWGVKNDRETTALEFVKQLDSMLLITKKWLDENSSDEKLNY